MALIQPVSWSQSAILKRMRDILLALSGTSSVTVSNSKETEIIERLDEVVNLIEKINTQLVLLTGNSLDIGETDG
jgi:hypothetical protein